MISIALSNHLGAVYGIKYAAELMSEGGRIVNTPMAHIEGGEHLLQGEKVANPLGRICEPDEVAALIHFLAATDCDFINGQAIQVDGGASAGTTSAAFEKLIA